jgi:DNA adenine methylase
MYINIQKKPNHIIIQIKKLIDDYNSIEDDVKITKKDETKMKKSKTEKNRKPKTIEEAKSSKESYYYWIRNIFNDMTQDEQNQPNGSAYFIFLNKTCFRGMYREGPNGFNVPFGNYKSPEIINEEHLKNISNLIKNVEFIHSDFEDSFKTIKKHDFIYADPPYVPENAKSFVGYTSDGFNLAKHKILFDLCKKHNFVMSNSDTDLVKNSFSNPIYTIEIISCKRSINSKKPNSKTNEVLISNF